MSYETTFSDGLDISPVSAVIIVEGFEDVEIEDYLRAWSYIIGTKLYMNLQGFYFRMTNNLIESGIINSEGVVNWEMFNKIYNKS